MRARLLMRVSALVALAVAAARPAVAFDFFDGRLTIHGYGGEQLRWLGRNLDTTDGIDLAQWYNVLNVEVESNLLPNGWGPFEIATFYSRFEARFDCVWSHGCNMFPTVDVYGNGADHLPKRLSSGHQSGLTGELDNEDTRRFPPVNRYNYDITYRDSPQSRLREPLTLANSPGFVSLFGNGQGPDQVFEPISKSFGDDPPPYVLFKIIDRCKFASQEGRGAENGHVWNLLGPWNPRCRIQENGALRNFPNPFNANDFNPILAGPDRIPNSGDEALNPGGPNVGQPISVYGRGELPFRPRPLFVAADTSAPKNAAQGFYYPSQGLVHAIETRHLDNIDQNFTQGQLQWNHGASQEQTGELKEAYVDLEMAEGRLWMRLGKQTIVWGKTELFRNTDQFNPQDFALSSLPSLEESRIALWSARGTWSFYNIGKFEDVRLELAVNLDKYQPADLGRCGEPFAIDVVCGITLGYFAHGIAGAGLAGTDKPPSPWNDVKGLEGGGRLEWRYRKFSFQLSDFYGYDDFPHPVRISTYERNVDPQSGRPRRFGDHGPCTTGAEPACLGIAKAVLLGLDGWALRNYNGTVVNHLGTPANQVHYNVGDLIIDPVQRADVLAHHPANLTAFAFGSMDCGVVGLDIDPQICGLAAVNSKFGPGYPTATIANGFSALLAGSTAAVNSATGFSPYLCLYKNAVVAACRTAFIGSLVPLNKDPADGIGPFADGGTGLFAKAGQALGEHLTPQQLALLGCGPYFSSDCDIDGVDLLNAEGSVLIQSWPGFEGTTGSAYNWDLRDTSKAQPGTLGFRGGPVATRYVQGKLVILPGARGPFQAGWSANVDGCIRSSDPGCAAAHSLLSPYTGQMFSSEMAALSSNMMMTFVSGKMPVNPDLPTIAEFDPNDPYGTGIIQAGPYAGQVRPGVDPNQVGGANAAACGFYKPQLCHAVSDFLAGLGVSRNSVRAAGNGEFGRRDFAWQSGGELLLGYEKHNVLGFAFDFAEDHTKSNWGVEASWVNRQPFIDDNAFDGISYSPTYNLTVSVDRPTFINFLNQNRTFFFNSQWFFQYIPDYHKSYTNNGPVNVLATFTILTGYHQDRLMLQYTWVYDFLSSSGAFLPQVTYRFTEAFSASVGVNLFFGREQFKVGPINEIRPALNRVGSHAYDTAVENGLSVLRTHDEIFTTLRYTF